MSESQSEEREEKYEPKADIKYGDRRHLGRKLTHFTDDYGAPQVRNSKLGDDRNYELDDVELSADMRKALEHAGLTDRQRQAINLVFFENMTQEATAEAMDVSDRAVRYFLRDGLTKLRRYLMKYTS
ncbi:sigma-70 family RNA polymerase sigma factor [Bacillus sp. FJAT-49870]|uniref:Sigma-70 family RNA polymerase sigma factor n=2 Tax=Lederbergia citri TaxID=2833580 RepID=A0A942TCM5_9BACI|nr:sigma-70 family RNA polymerase sigma factor [Lederbergia citri]